MAAARPQSAGATPAVVPPAGPAPAAPPSAATQSAPAAELATAPEEQPTALDQPAAAAPAHAPAGLLSWAERAKQAEAAKPPHPQGAAPSPAHGAGRARGRASAAGSGTAAGHGAAGRGAGHTDGLSGRAQPIPSWPPPSLFSPTAGAGAGAGPGTAGCTGPAAAQSSAWLSAGVLERPGPTETVTRSREASESERKVESWLRAQVVGMQQGQSAAVATPSGAAQEAASHDRGHTAAAGSAEAAPLAAAPAALGVAGPAPAAAPTVAMLGPPDAEPADRATAPEEQPTAVEQPTAAALVPAPAGRHGYTSILLLMHEVLVEQGYLRVPPRR